MTASANAAEGASDGQDGRADGVAGYEGSGGVITNIELPENSLGKREGGGAGKGGREGRRGKNALCEIA